MSRINAKLKPIEILKSYERSTTSLEASQGIRCCGSDDWDGNGL